LAALAEAVLAEWTRLLPAKCSAVPSVYHASRHAPDNILHTGPFIIRPYSAILTPIRHAAQPILTPPPNADRPTFWYISHVFCVFISLFCSFWVRSSSFSEKTYFHWPITRINNFEMP
jgi:hypothetical protein